MTTQDRIDARELAALAAKHAEYAAHEAVGLCQSVARLTDDVDTLRKVFALADACVRFSRESAASAYAAGVALSPGAALILVDAAQDAASDALGAWEEMQGIGRAVVARRMRALPAV